MAASIWSNLTVDGSRLDLERLKIHLYLIVDFVRKCISFLVKFIGSMLYTGYIYLADDVTYIWVHCIRYYKINHDPRALQSVNSRFLRVSAV